MSGDVARGRVEHIQASLLLVLLFGLFHVECSVAVAAGGAFEVPLPVLSTVLLQIKAGDIFLTYHLAQSTCSEKSTRIVPMHLQRCTPLYHSITPVDSS